MFRYKYINHYDVKLGDFCKRVPIEEWLESKLRYVHEHENKDSMELLELEAVIKFMVDVDLMNKSVAHRYFDYLMEVRERLMEE